MPEATAMLTTTTTMPEEGNADAENDSELEHDEEPMKGRTLGWYIEARMRQDRKPFEPWDVAVEYVKGRRFSRMSDFAAFFGHSPCWATDFKALAIRQGVFTTIEEWRECFQRGHTLGRSISDPRTWEEQQRRREEESQPAVIDEREADEANEPYLISPDGYIETYPVVLERIKAGELLSERAITRWYRCGVKAVRELRAGLISRGLVTDERWLDLMKRRRRARKVLTVNQPLQPNEERGSEINATNVRITPE